MQTKRSPRTVLVFFWLAVLGCSSSSSNGAADAASVDVGNVVDADGGKDPGDPLFCTKHSVYFCQDFERTDWKSPTGDPSTTQLYVDRRGYVEPPLYEIETTSSGHDLVSWTTPMTAPDAWIGTRFTSVFAGDEPSTSRFAFDLRIAIDGQRSGVGTVAPKGVPWLSIATLEFLPSPGLIDQSFSISVADGKVVLSAPAQDGLRVPLFDVSTRWVHVEIATTRNTVDATLVVSADGVEVGRLVAPRIKTETRPAQAIDFGVATWSDSSLGSRVQFDNITFGTE